MITDVHGWTRTLSAVTDDLVLHQGVNLDLLHFFTMFTVFAAEITIVFRVFNVGMPQMC